MAWHVHGALMCSPPLHLVLVTVGPEHSDLSTLKPAVLARLKTPRGCVETKQV
jgi:hypothetical protein